MQGTDLSTATTTARTAAQVHSNAPLSWRDTRALMRSDFRRLQDRMGMPPTWTRCALWFLLPAYQALFWYRISRCLYLRGWRMPATLLHLMGQYITHIDISPVTSIGRGCLIGHPPIVLCGRIGDNFTMNGVGGIGGGFDDRDIGGGPGLPVVGDDVTMAIRSTVLGPVRIGDRARLGPGSLVMRDVPAGAVVAAPLSRITRGDEDDAAPALTDHPAP